MNNATNSNTTYNALSRSAAKTALNIIGAACLAVLAAMSAAKAVTNNRSTETTASTDAATTWIVGDLKTIGGSPRVEHTQTEYVVKDMNDISSYEKLDQALVKFEFDEEFDEDEEYEEYSVVE